MAEQSKETSATFDAISDIAKAPLTRNFGDTVKGACYAILSVICFAVKLFWFVSKHTLRTLAFVLKHTARGMSAVAERL